MNQILITYRISPDDSLTILHNEKKMSLLLSIERREKSDADVNLIHLINVYHFCCMLWDSINVFGAGERDVYANRHRSMWFAIGVAAKALFEATITSWNT